MTCSHCGGEVALTDMRCAACGHDVLPEDIALRPIAPDQTRAFVNHLAESTAASAVARRSPEAHRQRIEEAAAMAEIARRIRRDRWRLWLVVAGFAGLFTLFWFAHR